MTVMIMTDDQRVIVAELRQHARRNPITSHVLAAKLEMVDRPMRHNIEILAKIFMLPIGRSSRGYYWRASIEDDVLTFDLLVKKIRSMAAECRLIKEQMTCRTQEHLDIEGAERW